jgi:hypothetical protein
MRHCLVFLRVLTTVAVHSSCMNNSDVNKNNRIAQKCNMHNKIGLDVCQG